MSALRHIPYAVLSAIILAAGSASAQTWYDARQSRLNDRVEAGIDDGSLTSREAHRLEHGMDRIERFERRAERDGRVSGWERRRLDHMMDRQSREIHKQRNDRQGLDLDGRNGWNHDGWRNGHRRHDHQGHDGWRNGGWNQDNNGRHHGWGRGHDGRGWQGHNDGWRHAGYNHRQDWQDRRHGDGGRNGYTGGREQHRPHGMHDHQSRNINHGGHHHRVTAPAPTAPTRVSQRRERNEPRHQHGGGRNGGRRDR